MYKDIGKLQKSDAEIIYVINVQMYYKNDQHKFENIQILKKKKK